MKRLILPLLVTAGLVVACFLPSFADDPNMVYQNAAAKYYEQKDEVVAEIMKTGINIKDLPVVLLIAQKGNSSAKQIADLKARGDSWVSILKARIFQPADFYMMIGKKITSTVYAPIFEKYKTAAKYDWAHVELIDSDIVNLVNLKFISSHYDYSIFEIMTMRDKGMEFVKILNTVKAKKEKMLADEKKKHKEEAKAKRAEEMKKSQETKSGE